MIDYEGKVSITYEMPHGDHEAEKAWLHRTLDRIVNRGTSWIDRKIFISISVTPEEATLVALARRIVPHGIFK